MSLTAISSPESARRKFFMNWTYILSTKVGIKRFCASEDRNESNSHKLAGIGDRGKFFMNSDAHRV